MRYIVSVFMFILSIIFVIVWAILMYAMLVMSVIQIVVFDTVFRRDTRLLADMWVDVLDKYNRWAIKVVSCYGRGIN